MSTKMLFADQKDEKDLREILRGHGMDLAGETEDHLIIKENDNVLAGGKIIEFEPNHFYLEVLGVKGENHNQGLGGIFLKSIVDNPWKYCKNPISEPDSKASFLIITIAKGKAASFYQKYGFMPSDFAMIPERYRGQCDDCLRKERCNPVPMIYKRQKGGKK